ncbi:hypothetical protein Tco_0643027 [Tanacetum coccineum]
MTLSNQRTLVAVAVSGGEGGEGDGAVEMGVVALVLMMRVASGVVVADEMEAAGGVYILKDPSEVLSIRGSHNSRDSISLKGGYGGSSGGEGGVVEVVDDVRQRRGWLLCRIVVVVDGSEMVGRGDGSHGGSKGGGVKSGARRLLEKEADGGGW